MIKMEIDKMFNVNADCQPDLHYMVDITERLQKIKEMVDAGQYFTINRARQYGKTTTLQALGAFLKRDYIVVSLDFQMLGAAKFKDENVFSVAFARHFIWALERDARINPRQTMPLKEELKKHKTELELLELFEFLSDICREAPKPVILLVDEVDSASNNQVFLDFLAQLRGYYINRKSVAAFHSVILAGIYDVKSIKRKIRSDEEQKVNSPWNIAADFLIDMSFSVKDIIGMLNEYEKDHHTNMDICQIAGLLHDYTSGYPYLVSRLCKLMDERVAGDELFPDRQSAWTEDGFLKAVRILLSEPNTLFDSLLHKLEDYPELDSMLRSLLFQGKEISYVIGVRSIEAALMFGFVKIRDNLVQIANRIFETLLYNFFLVSPEMQREGICDAAWKDKNLFIENGRLNMKRVIERFVIHFDDLYGDLGEKFYEDDGRRYFMLFLKPVINGQGNCYVEAETRNRERTDLIVDYHGERFIIETKVWYGPARHAEGERQLSDYLEHYHLKTGYMVTFQFNKRKEIGVKEVAVGDKVLVEAIV